PRETLIEEEEASFKISILSISFGLISPIEPANGIPLSTINGSLLAFKERVPRIRICIEAPGLEEVCVISTPAILPCRAWDIFGEGTSVMASDLIEATEPVTASR